MTLLVRKIYVIRTCESETLLRQHSNIECLYENNRLQRCNIIEIILLGNLQRSNMLAMFWQYSMLCRIIHKNNM